MQISRVFAALAVCAGLGACGDTVGQQAVVGAGGGLVGAALVNGNPIVGAALGTAANIAYCQQYPSKCPSVY